MSRNWLSGRGAAAASGRVEDLGGIVESAGGEIYAVLSAAVEELGKGVGLDEAGA